MSKTLRVIVVEPHKVPRVEEIDAGLESLQGMVGGYIECIYPFEDQVGLVCNEEGKLQGLPLNRCLMHEGEVYDIIAGTFLIVGLSSDDFRSLTDKEAEEYIDMFFIPQKFVKMNEKIMVIPDC